MASASSGLSSFSSSRPRLSWSLAVSTRLLTIGRSPSTRSSRLEGDSPEKDKGDWRLPESDRRPSESRTPGDLSPLLLAAAPFGDAGSVRICEDSAARAAPKLALAASASSARVGLSGPSPCATVAGGAGNWPRARGGSTGSTPAGESVRPSKRLEVGSVGTAPCCVLEKDCAGWAREKEGRAEPPPLEKEGRCIIMGCVLDHDGLGPLPPAREKDCDCVREKDSAPPLEKDCRRPGIIGGPPPVLEKDCPRVENDWLPPLEKESVAPPRRMPGSGGGPIPRFGDEGGSLAGGAGKESLAPAAAPAVLDHAEPCGCSLRRFRNSTCA